MSSQDVCGVNIVQSNTIVKKIGMGLHYTARKKLLWLTAPPYDLNLNGKLNYCPVPKRKQIYSSRPKNGISSLLYSFLQRNAGLYSSLLLFWLKTMSAI